MKRIMISLAAGAVIYLCCGCLCEKRPENTVSGIGTSDTAVTSGDGRYSANVPEISYDGATFIVMARSRDAHWGEWAIASDGYDGGTLNDATYDRNLWVAESYDIKLEFNEIYDTTASNGIFRQKLTENSMSGDYIADICVAGLIDACNLVPSGIFVDLKSVPHIDLEAEWWQQKLNQSIKILNKQYFAINDMLLNDKRDTYLLYFNKTTFDNNQLEYPYSMVYDGTWTNEKLLNYIKDFGADLNNNGYADVEDRIAYTFYLNDTFFVGAGIKGAEVDETGLPYIVDFSQKHSDIYDVVYSLIHNDVYNTFNVRTNGNDANLFKQVFDNGGLFMSFHMAHMMTVAQEYESVVGIVPQPKFDEAQSDYYSRAGYNGTTAVTILSSTPDLERAGILTEVFAAESKNYISPAFYETLFTQRYTSDDESKDMLDIVIKSEIIDLDQVFQWGHLIVRAANAAEEVGSSISSLYGKYVQAAKNKLDSTIDEYINLSSGN